MWVCKQVWLRVISIDKALSPPRLYHQPGVLLLSQPQVAVVAAMALKLANYILLDTSNAGSTASG